MHGCQVYKYPFFQHYFPLFFDEPLQNIILTDALMVGTIREIVQCQQVFGVMVTYFLQRFKLACQCI